MLRKHSKKSQVAAGNIKKTWEFITELCGKILSPFIVDGHLVANRRKIADGFNVNFHLFSGMTTKVASSTLNHNKMSTPKSNFQSFLADPKVSKICHSIYILHGHHCYENEIIQKIMILTI